MFIFVVIYTYTNIKLIFRFRLQANLSPDDRNISWMYPEYVGMTRGCAKKTNELLKALVGKVDGLSLKHTLTSFRIGSANDLSLNPKCTIFELAYRGGWKFEDDYMCFHYLTKEQHIYKGGVAVQGWKDPSIQIFSPTVDSFVDSTNTNVVNNIVKRLFGSTGLPEFQDGGVLLYFRFVMFASMLKDLRQLVSDLSANHILIRRIFAICIDFGVDQGTVYSWADKIRKRWLSDNTLGRLGRDKTEDTECFQELISQNNDMKAEIKIMKADREEDRKVLLEMRSMIQALSHNSPSPVQSFPKKRVQVGVETSECIVMYYMCYIFITFLLYHICACWLLCSIT